jgi:hypothetical protein
LVPIPGVGNWLFDGMTTLSGTVPDVVDDDEPERAMSQPTPTETTRATDNDTTSSRGRSFTSVRLSGRPVEHPAGAPCHRPGGVAGGSDDDDRGPGGTVTGSMNVTGDRRWGRCVA